ncbi:E1A-binding protein p400 [Acipenser ruthenus]|uniref:E1A-binding protein p400 n=1 Tax=Acipenser ruthenus TaxID=7906 RepID=A0A444UXK4_ACIRT|nr:E1A-binding protein p400 [Acipenser ruthenus]
MQVAEIRQEGGVGINPRRVADPSEDPYIMEEEDPAKCCALESSLWELQSLQKHYHPNVAKAASVVNKPLCQQEVDINQLLEVSAFESLQKHYHPNVAKAASVVNKPLCQQEVDINQLLEVSAFEEKMIAAKKEWEVQQLKKLKTKDEERMMLEEEEDLFTYTREDAYNMEYVYDGPDGQTEIMPLWTPPTPPQDDNDVYIDSVICLMYDSTPVPESKLPPVYVRKEHKRLKMDPSGRKKKQRHGETVIPPRSLFDKGSFLKPRREGKDQKKNFSLKQQAPFAKPLPSLVKPAVEAGQDNPEWLISEDWALLQAVKQLLELPLNLSIVSAAHTPNWDMVSDVVNSCSRVYRSPKQCRSRYENVIIPREEGKLVYEANPKKKTKSIYKSKNSRPLRTCQIYAQDDSATHIHLYNSRFELMKIIASKRSPPIKPLGINYDKPLPPIQVASQRAERIAKEKKALAEQQRAQQLAQQQAGPQPPPPPTPQPQTQQPAQPQAVPQAQAVVQAAGNTVTNTASLQAGTIKTAAVGTSLQTAPVSGNVIVNTVAGVPASSFQPTNKRLASPVIPATLTTTVGGSPQVVHTPQRTVSTPAAPAEVVAIATNQGVRTVTPVTASTVSTTLTPVQTQNRSLITQVNPATAPSMQLPPGKGITHAQLHLLRQQQAQVQVQQIQAQAGSPAQIKTVGKPTQTRVAGTQLQAQGQIQSQPAQTAQVTLTKPPVVSVPAVTTLPVTMAGISVAIGQPQKAGGQVVAHQLQMQQHLLNLKKQQAAAAAAAQQQKAVQTQVGQGQGTVQQKVTVQAQQPTQQKVTYTTAQLQPGIKTQFLTTSIAQAQKPSAAQQVQTQLQVAKLPQIVQQQTVANIQQMVSASQMQGQTQTLTLSQNTGQQQVQVIPAGTATAQKLLQQQVGLAASPHSPAQGAASSESQGQQQAKVQVRAAPAVRVKAPTKPS